ncbi:unnamed protein product [Nezara viridula]|uniref:Borealin C-terminal domain-containing protein n=1 Tax=Nezara viridula TaxID=85310 RepID=A0A9P0HJW5_NEZVI|nr:unnamed protein product [Nezara viridula]
MPRITSAKNRLNSTKFSEFYPGIASSPIREEHILSKNDLDLHILEHTSHIQKVADDYKARLIKFCTEEFEVFDKAIEECLSKGDFNFPVTPETLKVARAMFKKFNEGGLSDNKNTDDAGETGKIYESDSDETTTRTTTVKGGAKEATIVPELENNQKDDEISNRKIIDEENDSVFKKPAGITRKTRQASRTMNKEQYVTPRRTGYNKGYNIAKVTPGPDIDRPLSVLRRPVLGEMVVSMNGSPLVTSHDNISVPQMTIPLSNGRALTYLANDGLDPDESLCGEIDEETQKRLTVFYKLLEKKIKKKT